MLRISAVLAILVGLFMGFNTIVGFSQTLRYAPIDEHAFLLEHLVLQCVFAGSAILGGIWALWNGSRVLLAASWGVIFALTAPRLIRPAVPLEAMRQIASRGGTSFAFGVNPIEMGVAAVALVGLGLCIAHEIMGAPARSG
jgi:hypothetical protein